MSTPDYRQLCELLTERLEWYIAEDDTNENDPSNSFWLIHKLSAQNAVAEARAALAAEPDADVRYEFSIFNAEDEWEAGGDAPTLEEAMREGQLYLAHYSSDHCGPYRLELRRTELLPLPEAQP